MSRGGTSAPLEDELCRLEVRVVFAIGKKRLINSQNKNKVPQNKNKVPGAFNESDTVKTGSKSPEYQWFDASAMMAIPIYSDR